jgi:hypothetical protein
MFKTYLSGFICLFATFILTIICVFFMYGVFMNKDISHMPIDLISFVIITTAIWISFKGAYFYLYPAPAPPINRELFLELFAYVGTEIASKGHSSNFQYTERFLKEHSIDFIKMDRFLKYKNIRHDWDVLMDTGLYSEFSRTKKDESIRDKYIYIVLSNV